MQYNPKLKKAMEEIREILDKHDIAAYVALHTPGHGEFLMHLNPSYSCVQLDEATGGARIRSRLQEDHNGDVKAHEKMLQDTANMLEVLSTVTGQNAMQLIKLSEIADEAMGAEHTKGGFSSQQEQNN
jgi:hypothetical protein